MIMITYRGPGMSGGLSSAITQAWDRHARGQQQWWHIHNREIALANDTISKPELFDTIDQRLIQGHYQYCNEFLWPIMHDLADYAVYDSSHHRKYLTFNFQFGSRIRRQTLSSGLSPFIHDYQLAPLANYLGKSKTDRSAIFWHIPWPKAVRPEHVVAIAEIARGLLANSYVGFHTNEYAENFLEFVEKYLPAYHVNEKQMTISPRHSRRLAAAEITSLVVAPLGIDSAYWQDSSSIQQTYLGESKPQQKLVLSVDRTDYTKGVFERFRAIDQFLASSPQWRKQVTFLQICAKTREGIAAFDNYWQKCHNLAEEINNKWSTDDWKPIVWHTQPLSGDALAGYYASADVMLVTPVRDGLNLTAKEFVACQGGRPGVLVLSSGAGAALELGPDALPFHTDDPMQGANVINQSLTLSQENKANRMHSLKQRVKGNPLSQWWHTFEHLVDDDYKLLFMPKETTRAISA